MLSICNNTRIKSRKNWKNRERISEIKLVMDKHIWEGINHPSEKDDWKKVQKKNIKIAVT